MKKCIYSALQLVKGQRPIIPAVLFAIFFCHLASAQNLTYTTSWLGNSGAANSLYVQEEIHNMWVSLEGTSYTATWFDEAFRLIGVYGSNGTILPKLNPTNDFPFGSEIGGNSAAVFSAETNIIYRCLRTNPTQSAGITVPGAAIMGIAANDAEVFVSSLNGRVYVYDAVTLAAVRDFNVGGSGRLALDGAGFIWAITGNTTLKRYSNTGVLQSQSITLPAGNVAAAVTVNTTNNTMYVIDRGIDQNVKVYNNVTTSPTRNTDFGAARGILSGARPGLVGPQRFSFNVINDTNVPGHTFGACGIGVDNSGSIYVLHGINSGAHIEKYNSSGIFQWRLIGHTFEEGAYIDPTTDETDVYAGGHHYKMNYAAQANTEIAPWYGWGGAINESNAYNATQRGISFAGISPFRIANLFGSKFMYASAQRGEVFVYRIPSDSETLVNCGVTDIAPTWTRGSITDVDANGTIWSGDNASIIEKYPCTGVSGGIPTYNFNSPTTIAIPAPYSSTGFVSIKYIAETDVMYLIGRTTGTSESKISRYNNWSTTRNLVFTSELIFNNRDVVSFDVAGDYIFTDYDIDYDFATPPHPEYGLVKVWNANTGAFVMDMYGPADYTLHESDNNHNTQAFKRSNGEYVITFLDHWNNKTVVYRWNPAPTVTATSASSTTSTTAAIYPNPASGSVTIDFGQELDQAGAQVELTDLLGRKVYASGRLSGRSSLELSTRRYPKGTYIITITRGKKKVTKKLIIQ